MTAMFQSCARQQLHADTDTEKGTAVPQPARGLDHAVERRQPPVTIRKGALPRRTIRSARATASGSAVTTTGSLANFSKPFAAERKLPDP